MDKWYVTSFLNAHLVSAQTVRQVDGGGAEDLLRLPVLGDVDLSTWNWHLGGQPDALAT